MENTKFDPLEEINKKRAEHMEKVANRIRMMTAAISLMAEVMEEIVEENKYGMYPIRDEGSMKQ